MIPEGFVVVAFGLFNYVLCPSPPDAALVEYYYEHDVCILHLEDRLDYRKPIEYTVVKD